MTKSTSITQFDIIQIIWQVSQHPPISFMAIYEQETKPFTMVRWHMFEWHTLARQLDQNEATGQHNLLLISMHLPETSLTQFAKHTGKSHPKSDRLTQQGNPSKYQIVTPYSVVPNIVGACHPCGLTHGWRHCLMSESDSLVAVASRIIALLKRFQLPWQCSAEVTWRSFWGNRR